MMSLNDADALRQKLQENGFDAEQANGTMVVVDELVDHGIDRVLGSIESLRSDMDARFDDIDTRFMLIDKQFKLVDKRFDLIDRRLKAGLMWQPVISTLYTVLVLGAIVTIAYRVPDIIKWFS